MRLYEIATEFEINSSGWLSPQGKFYPCQFGEHGELAVKLLHLPDDEGWPALMCLRKGYIRIEIHLFHKLGKVLHILEIQCINLEKARNDIGWIIRHSPVNIDEVRVEWGEGESQARDSIVFDNVIDAEKRFR
jgi:hypothetical protein